MGSASRRATGVISTPRRKSAYQKHASATSTQQGSAQKRKREDDASPAESSKISRSNATGKSIEKRLKRYRDHPPGTYMEKLHRATTQRMFVIDRTPGGTPECPEEIVHMAGTTGNIYTIHIARLPTCNCPDHQKGHQCKHVVYVLHNVLKAPRHLQYQLAFVTSELRLIFSQAPLPPSSSPSTSSSSSSSHATRKPIEGDCPICFMSFEPEERLVFCRAACGNNVHAECFEQWAKSRAICVDDGEEQGVVRCVICRTPWEGDEVDQVKRICREKVRAAAAGMQTVINVEDRNEEGYVNVARELGLSGARDYSTYHQSWVRANGLGYG